MSDFEQAVAGTIDDAVAWAGESTRQWLDTYARLVARAAAGTATPEVVATEVSALAAAAARDLARVSATCVALGTAVLNLPVPDSDASPGGGGNGGGNGGGPP